MNRRFITLAALGLGALLACALPALAQTITTWTDRSGTITTGGTSQQVMAANGGRRAFLIQNPCTAIESLFVEQGATATTTTSVELPPCAIWQGFGGLSTNLAVNVNAATTGHAYTGKEAQ